MQALTRLDPIDYKPLDLPELSTTVMDQFIKECIKIEEDLIIKLLTQLLQREPTIEDFKECQRIIYPYFELNDYIIAYKNTPLGFVKHDFMGSSATVTFTPDAGTY